LLRSEISLQLAVPRLDRSKAAPKAGKVQQKQQYDRILFSKLRALRKQIADRTDVAPFVVFSDATLIEMAQQLPQSRQEFLAISGVGQTKLSRYGDEFLDLIAEYLDQ
jgi:ATP-dependent DNA helicase RecQ